MCVPLYYQRIGMRPLLHGFIQTDVRMHRVCWPAESVSFAAGKAWDNASQICNRFPAPYNQGTCQGDGKGVGSSPVADKAIACYCGGHLHTMVITCCVALGVPDTPVQRLQAVPCSKGGGKGGCQRGEYLLSRLRVQDVVAEGWQGAEAA